jgi:hypothetical protein
MLVIPEQSQFIRQQIDSWSYIMAFKREKTIAVASCLYLSRALWLWSSRFWLHLHSPLIDDMRLLKEERKNLNMREGNKRPKKERPSWSPMGIVEKMCDWQRRYISAKPSLLLKLTCRVQTGPRRGLFWEWGPSLRQEWTQIPSTSPF